MRNRFVLGSMFALGSVLLLGCDAETATTCVPEEVDQVAAAIDNRSLSQRVSSNNAALITDSANPGQIRVYLDYSRSIRGYLRGASCPECRVKLSEKLGLVGANTKKTEVRHEKKVDQEPFYDPTFANLLRALTTKPLRVVSGVSIQYYLFAEKVSPPAADDVFLNLVKDDECYRDVSQRDIEKTDSGEIAPKCYFDKAIKDKDNKEIFSDRNQSPLGPVFTDITQNLNKNSLYIVASDFFFSNDEAINPNSTAVISLANLIKYKGMHVRLYGFQIPFKGGIDDVPGHSFKMTGLLPFYFMAIGSPNTLSRFDHEMSDFATETKIPASAGANPRSLQETGRYQSVLIGARGAMAGLPKVTAELKFPTVARPVGASLVVNPEVDESREIPASAVASGAPVKVQWTISPPEGVSDTSWSANDFNQIVLGWRQGHPASTTDCSQVWELVPSASLGMSGLTGQGRTLESSIFLPGDTLNINTGTPYLIQFVLYPRKVGRAATPQWLNQWSSDNNTIEDDRREATAGDRPKPGAVIRTFNLKDFVDSLQTAVPDTRSPGGAPVAATVMAVQFR